METGVFLRLNSKIFAGILKIFFYFFSIAQFFRTVIPAWDPNVSCIYRDNLSYVVEVVPAHSDASDRAISKKICTISSDSLSLSPTQRSMCLIPIPLRMVLVYKEAARDWLYDPLATIDNGFDKVPIPVPGWGVYKLKRR